MVKKVSADSVNWIFGGKRWEFVSIKCSTCGNGFGYEPLVYTYPDGQQSICCSKECWIKIRHQIKLKEANK